MNTPPLEQFISDRGADLKAALDPSKNSTNVEKLAGCAVIGLRWFIDNAVAELARQPRVAPHRNPHDPDR